MVALLDVGAVGTPVDGLATTPADVSTNDTLNTGLNEVTESPGVTGAVDVGHDAVPPNSTPVQSNCGTGNACNLGGLTPEFAAAIDSFSTSWSGGGGSGSVNLGAASFTSVTNLTQLIAVLDSAIRSAGGGGATFHSANTLTVVGPFNTQIGVTTAIALIGDPGEKTAVDITGLTDVEAATIDRFNITIDGSPLDTSSINFGAITTRAQLATALDALPGIDVTQSTANGGTLTITADTVGDITFTGIELVNITQVPTSSTASFGFTTAQGGVTALDAAVAAAEDFSIRLGGVDVNFTLTPADFTNAASLAAALDAHPDVSAQVVVDGAGARIELTAAQTGSGTPFTELELIDNEAGPPTQASVEITGIDASAGQVDAFAISIDGVPVDTSGVDFELATDGASLAAELDKIAGIDVAYSAASGGTLNITSTNAGAITLSNASLQKLNELVGDAGANLLNGDPSGVLIIGNAGDDTLNGNSGQDELRGGADNDILNGGGGADTLLGGAGNDTYKAVDASDVLTELENEGTDRVETALAAFTLGDHIENLEFTGGGGFAGTGNALGNEIGGRSGDDTLLGKEGRDLLMGRGGNDQLIGADGGDTIVGGGGDDELFGRAGDDELSGGGDNDTVRGGDGDDLLHGDNGDDSLIGGENSDTLDGGNGKDTLKGVGGQDKLRGGAAQDVQTGGEGADTFLFATTDESRKGAAKRDIITDFEEGTDVIDLSDIDARTGSGNQAFSFIGTAAFSGTKGELRFVQKVGFTLVQGDTDGDGAADLEIELTGSKVLDAGDFVL